MRQLLGSIGTAGDGVFDRPIAIEEDHPLARVRLFVEELGADAEQARLIRAVILQSLYSFSSSELLVDQLRYNLLYRWFVGLDSDETPWSSHGYQVLLERLRSSALATSLLRKAMLRAHAVAAETPERFRIDRTLLGLWTAEHPTGSTQTLDDLLGVDQRDRARLDRARAIILQQIGDPALSPERIAAEMCMSRRALYLLFEKYGQTPVGAVREMRLDCCRRLLADPRQHHRKITDMAMDCGFVHTGTFSRQFKERFGQSPIRFRSAHLGAAIPSEDGEFRVAREVNAADPSGIDLPAPSPDIQRGRRPTRTRSTGESPARIEASNAPPPR